MQVSQEVGYIVALSRAFLGCVRIPIATTKYASNFRALLQMNLSVAMNRAIPSEISLPKDRSHENNSAMTSEREIRNPVGWET